MFLRFPLRNGKTVPLFLRLIVTIDACIRLIKISVCVLYIRPLLVKGESNG